MERIKKILSGDRVLLLLILFVSLTVFLPLFLKFTNLQFNNDFLQLCMRHAFFRKSIFEFGQFPLRSPYIGGGFPILGDPEDPSLSPLVLFTLLLGESAGLKVIALAVYLAGLTGMYLFTRRELGYPREGAAYSTLLMAFSGWFHMRFAGGNVNELYYFLLPLVLFFWRNYAKTGDSFAPLLTLFYIIAADGKVLALTVPFFLLLFIILDAVKYTGPGINIDFRLLRKMALLLVCAVLLSAVKILPVLSLFAEKGGVAHPIIYSHEGGYTRGGIQAYAVPDLLKGLTTDLTGEKEASPGTPELYVGGVAVLLFGISILLYFRSRARFILLFAVFLCLTLAYNSPVDIFKPLWDMPFFSSISRPYKYFNYFVVFIVALMGGEVFKYLRERIKNANSRRFLGALIFVGALLPPFAFAYRVYSNTFNMPPQALKGEREFSQAVESGINRKDSRMYFNLLQNVGTINWFGGLLLPENAVPAYGFRYMGSRAQVEPNAAYKGEAFLTGVNNSAVVALTPDKITARVSLAASDVLTINQNYDRDFVTDKGALFSNKCLLAVKLPDPGKYSVELTYVPRWFYAGLFISAATLACLFWRRALRGRDRPGMV